MAPALELTQMRRRDMKAVLAIEARVFPEPWSATIFSSELALRRGRSYKVAKDGRRVIGYRGLMFVDEEAHITTLAVAPEAQGRGVATELLVDAVHTALDEGAVHLSLEVATGNDRAQALYRRFGFMPVGVRKRYYPVTGEDAFVMWAYDLNSPAYSERLAGITQWLAVRP
jgi:ribosomal-protein-alanine N-acetyltransferase